MSFRQLEVGRIAGLWRYPVKAMAAEPRDDAELSWHGLAGDRRWAFVRQGQNQNGFPWLTQREQPSLALYRPTLTDLSRPNASPVNVQTPSGTVLDVADPALGEELGAAVMKCDRGLFDAMPLSVLTTRSLASLGRLVGAELDVQRFRPNLLIEATGSDQEVNGEFPEDAWVGAILRVGGACIRVDARDKRCAVVGVDPSTARRNPAVLRTIAQARDARLGVYGSTVRPGRLAIGDAVILESSSKMVDPLH